MLEIALDIHKDINIRVDTIGEEQQPIIVVDNFMDAPERLIDYAAKNSSLVATKDLYPGVRSKAPDSYLNLIQGSLGQLIYRTFQISPQNISGAEAFFSIVATPPEQLHPLQRIPHMDGANPNDIAFLHYLCDDNFGGTSFYRHKSTGHEYIDQRRYHAYLETLKQEINITGLPKPPQYMDGDTELFERIISIAAKFNRLIIYRGTSLHSGNIDSAYQFDTDHQTGRLTATSFLYSAV